MKRLDGVIIAGLLLVCAVLFLLFYFNRNASGGKLKAEIYVDGQLVQTMDLPESGATEVPVAGGKVVLSAEPDGVSVSFADCPNQICRRTGKITLRGQMITCLPNRVIVRLIGGSEKSEVDAIAG